MGLVFEVVKPEVDEIFPENLKGCEITNYLSQLKANSLDLGTHPGTVLLTSDTIVWFRESVLEKPGTPEEAVATLRQLSGNWHEVITSVCLRSQKGNWLSHAITRVKFTPLTGDVIDDYVASGLPMDKAGAYGIQDWIGLIGVEAVEGSYTNVVGLPTHLVYQMLGEMAETGF